jgi:hypothetical protein
MKCCASFDTPTHHNATQTLLAATAGIRLLASTCTSLLENITLHYVLQGEVISYYNGRTIQPSSILVRQFSWKVALNYICCYSYNYQVFSYVALLARLQKVSGESETWQRGTRKPAGDFLQAEQKTLALSCTTFSTEASFGVSPFQCKLLPQRYRAVKYIFKLLSKPEHVSTQSALILNYCSHFLTTIWLFRSICQL